MGRFADAADGAYAADSKSLQARATIRSCSTLASTHQPDRWPAIVNRLRRNAVDPIAMFDTFSYYNDWTRVTFL
jgi:hypothetical protein